MCHYIPEFWKTLKRYNSRAKALFFAKKQEIKILAFLSNGELHNTGRRTKTGADSFSHSKNLNEITYLFDILRNTSYNIHRVIFC